MRGENLSNKRIFIDKNGIELMVNINKLFKLV